MEFYNINFSVVIRQIKAKWKQQNFISYHFDLQNIVDILFHVLSKTNAINEHQTFDK